MADRPSAPAALDRKDGEGAATQANLQRLTISLGVALGAELDQLVKERQYRSRSEAVRDLIGEGLERWRTEMTGSALCVANLSYVVDRRMRALSQKIAELQHAHHDLVASSTVVRLDHFHSLESVILKGPTGAVRAFADRLRAERGVRFGALNLLLVTPGDDHDRPDDHFHDGHRHLSPTL